jgi:hypothetical protein
LSRNFRGTRRRSSDRGSLEEHSAVRSKCPAMMAETGRSSLASIRARRLMRPPFNAVRCGARGLPGRRLLNGQSANLTSAAKYSRMTRQPESLPGAIPSRGHRSRARKPRLPSLPMPVILPSSTSRLRTPSVRVRDLGEQSTYKHAWIIDVVSAASRRPQSLFARFCRSEAFPFCH